jgi:hypothetical protein
MPFLPICPRSQKRQSETSIDELLHILTVSDASDLDRDYAAVALLKIGTSKAGVDALMEKNILSIISSYISKTTKTDINNDTKRSTAAHLVWLLASVFGLTSEKQLAGNRVVEDLIPLLISRLSWRPASYFGDALVLSFGNLIARLPEMKTRFVNCGGIKALCDVFEATSSTPSLRVALQNPDTGPCSREYAHCSIALSTLNKLWDSQAPNLYPHLQMHLTRLLGLLTDKPRLERMADIQQVLLTITHLTQADPYQGSSPRGRAQAFADTCRSRSLAGLPLLTF